MTPVLTAAAMRAADAYTIDRFGIPGFTLMESAGRGAAYELLRRFGSAASFAIYCGKGNNGGDGFVIARYLCDAGADVHVIHLAGPGSMSTDADAHFELLERLGSTMPDSRLHIARLEDDAPLPDVDVHVDALLGTGLTSDLREPVRGLVARLNAASGQKVAVDIPTGLHADVGRPLGVAFRADETYTMGAAKPGLLLNDGPSYAGRVEVLEIGIPHFALLRAGEEHGSGCARLSSDDIVRGWMPERGGDAHKYSVGLALVVAGSRGMTGAPVMAASAAARVGAGYVVCGCDERIQDVLAGKLTEITTIPLPASDRGIGPDGGLEALSPRLEKAGALLVGCGLGRAPDTQEFVRRLLESARLPVVIDADGLNALSGQTDFITEHARGRWILTPHMGEFRRLAGRELDAVDIDPDDRVALAQHFARAWNCVLILKGLPSVTATPDGSAWINATGGPALASAGTGDVLAGLCVGLLAQGLSPEQAAISALHLGGAAADRYTRDRSARSLQAMDLLDSLPPVMKDRLHS
ncbi:MAG: NAD(P)H-hydrate dehydratase [Rhodothermales bacterium]